MVFSSVEFLCVFFPIVFLLYFLMLKIKFKNMLLIVASLIFYAYGEPVYILLMIASTGFNYMFARVITDCGSKNKKCFMAIDIVFNICILFYFKYAAFFITTFNQITGMDLKVLNVELPIGISFFTFQALSYVIDVYRGTTVVQKNFWKLLLYISFFPQLIAGPIVKYRDISEALEDRKTDIEQISVGLRRFICGLGKKVLIANTVGQAADMVFNLDYSDLNIITAWIGAISYMLQIYYDFSGYSDMAIGLGRIFGFKFQENFNYPYGAASIKEFWRRWHISLSTWFKEYLYIPLGGNRKGKLHTAINKFVVFFCTGIWHGANWTFIIWGLYHGLFSVLEGYITFFQKIPKAIRYFYTMVVVCIGFVIFRADNIMQGLYIIKQMFTGVSYDSASMSFAFSQLTPWFITMTIAGFIGMAPIKPVSKWIHKIENDEIGCVLWKNMTVQIFTSVFSIILLAWCIIRLSGNTYNPFIYFRF